MGPQFAARLTQILLALACGGVAFAVGWAIKWAFALMALASARAVAERTLREGMKATEAERALMIEEGRADLADERGAMEEELGEIKRTVNELDEQMQQRETAAQQRASESDAARAALDERDRVLEARAQAVEGLRIEVRQRLERISATTIDQIKEQIIQSILGEERRDAAHVVQRAEAEMERSADARAREIVTAAMQCLPVTQELDTGPAGVETPSAEAMVRLLAREGRNLRILERLLGVEILVDDTRDGLSVSANDPVAREMAKATFHLLFKENRIHPSLIEMTVKKVRRDIEDNMRQEASSILRELGIRDLKRESVETLGRLLYRYSYGQNQLYHSKEVALLAAHLAQALGCDPAAARRAGLLHDIGKAVSDDGRPHTEIGVELARKWGEPEHVVNAIASHHDDVEQTCVESHLVKIADAISGSRPGARQETITNYLDRVEKLEKIAESFEGVEKAFAIYAGRELRIQVDSERITDERAAEIAVEVARRVERELTYPGKITITVIRELKASVYTR
jgi:ribonuclease Y